MYISKCYSSLFLARAKKLSNYNQQISGSAIVELAVAITAQLVDDAGLLWPLFQPTTWAPATQEVARTARPWYKFSLNNSCSIKSADLLFEVGAEKSKGSSGVAGGRGALLSSFHGSFCCSLVIIRDARRHTHRQTTCPVRKCILAIYKRFLNVKMCHLVKKPSSGEKLLRDFRTSFYTQKRKRELDKSMSHDRPSAADNTQIYTNHNERRRCRINCSEVDCFLSRIHTAMIKTTLSPCVANAKGKLT